jgi:nucleoside-diphosphate-sugar epimerase
MINWAEKTVLVSGAAGFIPSHLSEFYLKKGAKVIGLDNFITGMPRNIAVLKNYENFEFIEVDVCNKEFLKPLGSRKIDYIFSMASPASPIDFAKIPLEIMAVNAIGTWNLLDIAKATGARFLEASTSETYGDPLVHPQTETYFGNVNPNGPRSCYDESKRFAESLTINYGEKNNVEVRIIRIFNTYGPRMRPDDGRVVPNFISQAMAGTPLTLHGDGSQTRSFCYVSDLVDGIHLVMMGNYNRPVNVGNPNEHTIAEAAKLTVEVLNSSSEIKSISSFREDDPMRRCPDISLLRTLGEYSPKVDFKEGLRQTAEYFSTL